MKLRTGVVAGLVLASLGACTSTARISDVYAALDGEGNRRRNVFFTDSVEVHCLVEAGIGRTGVTIEVLIRQVARYDFDSHRYIDSNRVIASADQTPPVSSPGQPDRIDIELVKQDPSGQTNGNDLPFPAGRYQCEATLDGVAGGTAIFNVEIPPCPTAQIPQGGICFGFYDEGTQCPAYGLSSEDPAKCSCEKAGWNCAL